MECQSHKQTIPPVGDQVDNVPFDIGNGSEESSLSLNDASHQCKCKDDK